MPAGLPLVGRETEMNQIRAALAGAAKGSGSLLLLSGPAGIGKTRLLNEVVGEASKLGVHASKGTSLLESAILYHPWAEALAGLGLGGLVEGTPSPRLLGLYLLSEAGVVAGRAERPRFEQETTLVATMLNNAAEFLRDALGPGAGGEHAEILRFAVGTKGIVVVREDGFGLLAVLEGGESELFLRDLHVLASVLGRAGATAMPTWDGNRAITAVMDPLLQGFLDSGKYDGVDHAADGKARKLNLFENVLLGLQRASRAKPLCILIDDIQWADPSSLGLLQFLARQMRGDAVLFLAAYRVEEAGTSPHLREALDQLDHDGTATEISVPPLSSGDAGRLASEALGGLQIPDELQGALFQQTAGNPLLLAEVVWQLRADGGLAVDPAGHRVRLTRPIEALRIPNKVRDAIERKCARLSRAELNLVKVASVCGTRFRGRTVATVIGQPEAEVLRTLDAVGHEHGMIRADESGWSFDHPLMREVIYAQVPPELRRLYHRQVADTLQGEGEPKEAVGEHYARARDARGVPLLRDAAENASQRGANDEADRLLGLALEVAAPKEAAEIQLQRAEILEAAARFDAALAALDRAAELGVDGQATAVLRAKLLLRLSRFDDAMTVIDGAAALAPRDQRVALLVARSDVLNRMGRQAAAREASMEALKSAGSDDVRGRADALLALAQSEWRSALYSEGLAHGAEGLQLMRKLGDKKSEADALVIMAFIHWSTGDLERSLEFERQSLAISRLIGDRYGIARISISAGDALMEQRDLEGAREVFLEALAVQQAMGSKEGEAITLLNLGSVAWLSGEPAAALAHFEKSYEIGKAVGSPIVWVASLVERVRALLDLGRTEEAAARAREALDAATAQALARDRPMAQRAVAEVDAAQGSYDRGAEGFRSAAEAFAAAKVTIEVAETHLRWGTRAAEAGRRDEARELLTKAAEEFAGLKLDKRAGQAAAALGRLDG